MELGIWGLVGLKIDAVQDYNKTDTVTSSW